MELSLSAEDDCDGRGPSASLAPFLARLSHDERLGWTAVSRSRADDTESLNVNISDCGSCHLSEVSSVLSWLNETAAVDDDYSSCAIDDESSSEKDDVDEDEDDSGPEIRPLFLLERCLEEKLLEQQQKTDIVYPGISDCAAVSANFIDESSDWPHEVETSTMKRASRNLFSFKSSDSAVECVNTEGQTCVSDTNCATSMPLHRGGSRCNPDFLLCTGAIYDFNSSSDKADHLSANSEVSSVNTNDAVMDVQHGLQAKPQQTMHKLDFSYHSTRILPSETAVKNESLVKDVAQTLLSSNAHLADRSAVDSKLAVCDSKQNKASADTQQTNIANKQITYRHYSSCKTSAAAHDNKSLDDTNDCSWQNKSLADFQCRRLSCEKSKQQQEAQQGVASKDKLMSAEDMKTKTDGELSADDTDAASVVSDEAEKAAENAHSLAMPAVEDGLSNSDISDVDEAFSMFAGLKPPDPVPVDTSFGSRSTVAGDAMLSKIKKDPDSNVAIVSGIFKL